MKRFILGSVLAAAVIVAGCGTFHERPPEPATSFLGIHLGDSTAEVVAVLGQPEYIDEAGDMLVYEYDSVERAVMFDEPTREVIGVISANPADSLDRVEVFKTKDEIKSLLGEPERVKTGDLTYMWLYDRFHILVSFYNDNDLVVGMGLYWPGRLDIDPE